VVDHETLRRWARFDFASAVSVLAGRARKRESGSFRGGPSLRHRCEEREREPERKRARARKREPASGIKAETDRD
jgi:hypothetical protein